MQADKQKRSKTSVLQWILIGIVLVSGGLAVRELMGYHQGKTTYQSAQDSFTQVQTTQEGEASAEVVPELDFERIEVDFAALQAKNPDVVGWIQFDALPISYPVMQGKDDEVYLHHMWNGQPNRAGSIFLEAENKSWDDLHTIVYGHNMKNGSMFGQLKKYAKEEFYNENDGWYTLYLPNGEIRRYQIFGVKTVNAASELYTIGFDFDEKYTAFLKNMCKGRYYDPGVAVYSEDRVMTLSTCVANAENRLVVNARLAAILTEEDFH